MSEYTITLERSIIAMQRQATAAEDERDAALIRAARAESAIEEARRALRAAKKAVVEEFECARYCGDRYTRCRTCIVGDALAAIDKALAGACNGSGKKRAPAGKTVEDLNAKLKAMTPEEILETSVSAGIHNPDRTLTEAYQDNEARAFDRLTLVQDIIGSPGRLPDSELDRIYNRFREHFVESADRLAALERVAKAADAFFMPRKWDFTGEDAEVIELSVALTTLRRIAASDKEPGRARLLAALEVE